MPSGAFEKRRRGGWPDWYQKVGLPEITHAKPASV